MLIGVLIYLQYYLAIYFNKLFDICEQINYDHVTSALLDRHIFNSYIFLFDVLMTKIDGITINSNYFY